MRACLLSSNLSHLLPAGADRKVMVEYVGSQAGSADPAETRGPSRNWDQVSFLAPLKTPDEIRRSDVPRAGRGRHRLVPPFPLLAQNPADSNFRRGCSRLTGRGRRRGLGGYQLAARFPPHAPSKQRLWRGPALSKVRQRSPGSQSVNQRASATGWSAVLRTPADGGGSTRGGELGSHGCAERPAGPDKWRSFIGWHLNWGSAHQAPSASQWKVLRSARV